MKLMCKLFWHKWKPILPWSYKLHCSRCGELFEHIKYDNEINRSDLDESENVFREGKQ